MKKLFTLLLIVSIQQNLFAQGVKIGGTGNPDPSAILELDGSSGKGLLLPRMTTANMNASNAADGMVIYNSTDASIYLRKNAAWQKIAEGNAAGGGFSFPHASSHEAPGSYVLDLTNTGTGSSSGAIKGFSENGNGGFFSSNTGNALITGTGKVGIGTSSPTYPLTLDAAGNGFVHRGGGVEIGTNVSALGGMLQTFTNHPLRFGTGSNITKMILTTTGELGLGTVLPWAKMHISYNNDELLQLDNTNPLATGIAVKQFFKIGSYYTGAIGTTGQTINTARISFFTGADLTSSSLTERMSILNNGNIGINSTSPTSKLEVVGKTVLQQTANDNAALEIKGAIKVSGSSPAAFVVTVPNGAGEAVTINNAACNGKPNAILIVTQQGGLPQAFSLMYNSGIAKWQIVPAPYYVGFAWNTSFKSCDDTCVTSTYALASDGYIISGTKFNVLVIEQ